MQPIVQWQSPSPLWPLVLNENGRSQFVQPALLRFARDTFMEDLQATLADGPDQFQGYVARYETWRTPDVGWQAVAAQHSAPTLKLYHPAHSRFYLVAASLVCRLPGLPDRSVDSAAEERVSFVLRRLVPKTSGTGYDEYAWEPGTGWLLLTAPNSVAAAEERLPLFPLTYHQQGKSRRLLAGLVPVGSRETFQAAPALDPLVIDPDDLTGEDTLADPRMAQFREAVLDGLTQLRTEIADTHVSEQEAREVYVFALLDLLMLLDQHLPAVRQAITGGTPLAANMNPERLRSHIVGAVPSVRLQAIWTERAQILAGTIAATILATPDGAGSSYLRDVIQNEINILDPNPSGTLSQRLQAALGSYQGNFGTGQQALADEPPPVPKLDTGPGALYQVRCVYERPRCKLDKQKAVVSDPSVPFHLAPFFDPDAPYRPVRIQMPVDTSIAGLRQFPRSVSFLLSDELRKQIERVQGVTLQNLDDGAINDAPGINIGMICTLSIPIIMICALILLMIIVQLLNIVFWWLPFFKICFPLNLKAGGAS